MHWTVGEPWYVTRDRVDRLLSEVQPWQLKFAFLPVNIQDNEWVWLEYYERQPVYSRCGDGVSVYRWRTRSVLHPDKSSAARVSDDAAPIGGCVKPQGEPPKPGTLTGSFVGTEQPSPVEEDARCRCIRAGGENRFNINCAVHGKAP